MNKVITINLGGNAYQIEEGGYDALRAYLDNAATRLQDNPDKDEIISDIERAIADKFRSQLGSHKTVVETKEVSAIIAGMGPVETDGAQTSAPGASGPGGSGTAGGQSAAGEERSTRPARPPRRLYRIREGAQIFGVCNGVAAYLGVDPTLVRLAFLLLFIPWSLVFPVYSVLTFILPVYFVLGFVIPEAATPEQKAAAYGAPSTAEGFIQRAKEGYYEAMKGFPDRKARREWRNRFQQQVRGGAEQWRQTWQSGWGQQPPAHPGMVVALPFISLAHGAVTILWVCASISLLSTGSLFGRALPANVPLWVAAMLLFLAYGALAVPLKAARRTCSWGGGRPGLGWSLMLILDAAVWVTIFAALLWLAAHYFPELRAAVQILPALGRQAVTDISSWWKNK